MNKKNIITALLTLVAMAGQAQAITGRVIDEQSLPMAFAQQVMLADSITKNSVCYATVYDANENRLAFKFVVSHDLLPLHFS